MIYNNAAGSTKPGTRHPGRAWVPTEVDLVDHDLHDLHYFAGYAESVGREIPMIDTRHVLSICAKLLVMTRLSIGENTDAHSGQRPANQERLGYI